MAVADEAGFPWQGVQVCPEGVTVVAVQEVQDESGVGTIDE
jgi:hypothetical protein